MTISAKKTKHAFHLAEASDDPDARCLTCGNRANARGHHVFETQHVISFKISTEVMDELRARAANVNPHAFVKSVLLENLGYTYIPAVPQRIIPGKPAKIVKLGTAPDEL
jgi:hypothetical protein